MSKPLEAITKEIIDKNKIKILDSFRQFVFFLKSNVALPSTTIKLDIALINVSTVEIVKDKPSITINKDINVVCFLSNNEKKPRSGLIFESIEKATIPAKPI